MAGMMEVLVPVICGFAYGITSVLVGQPLETVKTQMQTLHKQSAIQTGKMLVQEEGIRGLYRGGLPLVLGGGLIRSAQFGAYENVITFLRNNEYTRHLSKGPKNIIDPLVVIAGVCGGISRGMVEGPFEFIKVRQQVVHKWSLKEVFQGYGATMFRNAFLFGFFVTYLDISKQLVPGGLSPFWAGAINSSLAWLTIWPLDVVKSRMQSGLYPNKSFLHVFGDIVKNHPNQLLSGVVPGLLRSSVANGTSMIIYKKVEKLLQENILNKSPRV